MEDEERVRRRRAADADALVRRIDLMTARQSAWSVVRPDYVTLDPPPGWRHPVSGRSELQPQPQLVNVGRYLRRARYFVGKSQDRLAKESRVSQSTISRAERALAPAMRLDHLTSVAQSLGRAFPFGCCPHEHDCAWQPIEPPRHIKADAERFIELILAAMKIPENPDSVSEDE